VKRVRLDGEVLSVQQAATRLGIAVGTVKQRIKAGKLDSFDDAMGNVNQKTVMVAGEAMSMRAAARKLGVSIATVQRRVEKGQALEAKAESVDSDLFISAVISYEQDVRAQIAVGLAVERGEPLSLREVGEIMEISHESVRQIEERYREQLGAARDPLGPRAGDCSWQNQHQSDWPACSRLQAASQRRPYSKGCEAVHGGRRIPDSRGTREQAWTVASRYRVALGYGHSAGATEQAQG
jgi:predicted DNA-binding protein (UPF0251 family)